MDFNLLKYTDNEITKILLDTKSIALIEASHNPNKPSNQVMKYLLDIQKMLIELLML